MLLKNKINEDFLIAYKNKEMEKKNFLGVLKGAIQAQEGRMIDSTDENVLKVIKAMEKGINETIEAKKKLNEGFEQQTLEMSYLQPYLPTLMGDDEVRGIVKEILSRDGINKNQGFLMGTFNKENQGKAFDNKRVSQIIQEELV